MRWDLFCNVIDNYGDVGVCWRLARELAARGHAVRLWIDDASALWWMAPEAMPGVTVLPWDEATRAREPGDVVVEAFGCELPAAFVDKLAAQGSLWINLEHLSAEGYVERSHGLRSPVREGVEKFFFYPGFTLRTGGLLRERDLDARRDAFDGAQWLRARGIAPTDDALRVSLFCYEPPRLRELVERWVHGTRRVDLLATAGRASDALRSVLPANTGALRVHWLPLLSQRDYDHLLWSCDFNFVRGEDSIVRALWAGRPFVWQLYPQDDAAEVEKLEAFLRWLRPPDSMRDFFRAWNGSATGELPAVEWPAWRDAAADARARALALPELAAGLERFARDRGRI